jgi:hypothetical protein
MLNGKRNRRRVQAFSYSRDSGQPKKLSDRIFACLTSVWFHNGIRASCEDAVFGGIAQLVERVVRNDEAWGSNPHTSTDLKLLLGKNNLEIEYGAHRHFSVRLVNRFRVLCLLNRFRGAVEAG